MNRPIRAFGIVMMLLFLVLVGQLANLQVAQASHLEHDPRNTRNFVRDFSRNRGAIVTSDGVVVAQSVPAKDTYHYLREYPKGPMYAFVTGYESLLYGSDGVEHTYGRDLDGSSLPVSVHSLGQLLTTTQPTGTVTLTISNALQQAATNALGAQVGAVVALDPTTGAVLALVSQPSFDPNELSSHDATSVRRAWAGLLADPGHPLLARAYRERYAPGSTFKVVTASAVLDHQPALATRDYPVRGALTLPNTAHTLHNFGGESCGGAMPELLRVSCDTGFAQIGLDLGASNLSAEASSFGFDARPPLDLGSTAPSNFPSAAAFARDLPGVAFSAIGQQDVSATPLEMALVSAGIANHGTIMTPHVMQDVRDDQGRLVRQFTPTPWRQASSPATADAIAQLMVAVVTGGTATNVALPGVQVAAKTGTAEVDQTHTNAWMIAFAPANSPRIAVAVALPNLTGVGNEVTGAERAGPIVRQVLAAYLGVAP